MYCTSMAKKSKPEPRFYSPTYDFSFAEGDYVEWADGAPMRGLILKTHYATSWEIQKNTRLPVERFFPQYMIRWLDPDNHTGFPTDESFEALTIDRKKFWRKVGSKYDIEIMHEIYEYNT